MRSVDRQPEAEFVSTRVGLAPGATLMNIYFACSLTGGRADETTYGAIVDHLLSAGHDIPTAHLASPEVMELERVVDPLEVFQRDIAWIRNCDAMIAEVSTPSHGVGYEIAFALNLNKPVLCCFQKGRPISKMITGNDAPTLTVYAYEDVDDALTMITEFLLGTEEMGGR